MKLYLQYSWAVAKFLAAIALFVWAFNGLRHAHKDGAENCWRCKQLQSEGRAP